jgi:hypothetical protein
LALINPFAAFLELPLSKGQLLVLSFMPGNLNYSEEKLKLSSSFLALLRLPVSEIFPKKNSPLRLISTFQTAVRNLIFGLLSLT